MVIKWWMQNGEDILNLFSSVIHTLSIRIKILCAAIYIKTILLLILLLFNYKVLALDVSTFYTSSNCDYVSGVITEVSERYIYVLDVQGKIQKISRYSIVAVSVYPVDTLSINKIDLKYNDDKPLLFAYKITSPLGAITGWPINFSDTSIALITTSADSVSVKREDIYSIEKVGVSDFYNIQENIAQSNSYILEHPPMFANCDNNIINKSNSTNPYSIAPQEFETNLIVTKNRLDYFQQEIEQLQRYYRNQQFYSTPQVYSNTNLLGLWLTTASRYGSNKNRTNNGAPFFESQFSSGPFGYQHILYTGALPNDLLLHEEIQTQIFYSFKADYFNFSYLLDPNMILVGEQFNWSQDELRDRADDRIADKTFINVGLDYKKLSFFVAFVNAAIAYQGIEGNFYSDNLYMNKFGVKFAADNMTFSFIIGSGSSTESRDEDVITPSEEGTIYESTNQLQYDNTILCQDTSYFDDNADTCAPKIDANKIGVFTRDTFITNNIQESINLDTWRFNFAWQWKPDILVSYSIIHRKLNAIYASYTTGKIETSRYYDNTCSTSGIYSQGSSAACGSDKQKDLYVIPASQSQKDNKQYDSSSNTHAFYVNYKLNYKYYASGMLSHETHSISGSSSKNHIKLALGISMLF